MRRPEATYALSVESMRALVVAVTTLAGAAAADDGAPACDPLRRRAALRQQGRGEKCEEEAGHGRGGVWWTKGESIGRSQDSCISCTA